MKNQKVTVRPNGSLRVQDVNNEPDMARQEFKKDCDINEIIRKYKKTGQITHMASKQGKYLDLANAPDYMQAMTIVAQAKQSFDVLPAELRARFKNDPAQLLEFVHDAKNYDEAAKLGLVPEKQKPVETPAPSPDDKK